MARAVGAPAVPAPVTTGAIGTRRAVATWSWRIFLALVFALLF